MAVTRYGQRLAADSKRPVGIASRTCCQELVLGAPGGWTTRLPLPKPAHRTHQLQGKVQRLPADGIKSHLVRQSGCTAQPLEEVYHPRSGTLFGGGPMERQPPALSAYATPALAESA